MDNQNNPVDKVVGDLQKDFKLVGTSRIHSLGTWISAGLVLGALVAVAYVANQSGKFDASQASDRPGELAGEIGLQNDSDFDRPDLSSATDEPLFRGGVGGSATNDDKKIKYCTCNGSISGKVMCENFTKDPITGEGKKIADSWAKTFKKIDPKDPKSNFVIDQLTDDPALAGTFSADINGNQKEESMQCENDNECVFGETASGDGEIGLCGRKISGNLNRAINLPDNCSIENTQKYPLSAKCE